MNKKIFTIPISRIIFVSYEFFMKMLKNSEEKKWENDSHFHLDAQQIHYKMKIRSLYCCCGSRHSSYLIYCCCFCSPRNHHRNLQFHKYSPCVLPEHEPSNPMDCWKRLCTPHRPISMTSFVILFWIQRSKNKFNLFVAWISFISYCCLSLSDVDLDTCK